MERLILAAALVAVAVVVAVVLQRRKPDPPARGDWTVPAQLDRADFDQPGAPWLVVLFSSATCDACAGVRQRADAVASDQVVVQEVEAVEHRALHERYGVDAVPTLVIADDAGVVRASFIGPVNATDLWGTLAEVRQPGSVPPDCDHGTA